MEKLYEWKMELVSFYRVVYDKWGLLGLRPLQAFRGVGFYDPQFQGQSSKDGRMIKPADVKKCRVNCEVPLTFRLYGFSRQVVRDLITWP